MYLKNSQAILKIVVDEFAKLVLPSSACDRSVSNDCIVSNVSSDVSIATNVIIVVNISIVRGVKKKKNCNVTRLPVTF